MPLEGPRIGYVLKVYPRLSETFVVSEIVAREAAGARIEIFALRPPRDARFHETLGSVRAPVTWLTHAGRRAADLWELLRESAAELPGLPGALDDLLAADAADGAQALELALLARERGIDHLHAHFASAATTVARLAGRLAGIPYSFTAHAKDLFHEDVVAAELDRKLADAHHVVTISAYNARFLRERHGAERVRLVRNGLMLDAFPFAPPVERPPVIAAVGRLVEKKGFDVLLDACALLARSGRRFRCELAGDGPLAGELRARAEGPVRFHGALPQREVRDLVAGAAVLAAPCVVASDGNRDGLPTVLLEAMALGTPCVATRVTGIPEAIRDGSTGLLVPERDAGALAAAL
ncbi:MAG TPA: glycosyltransferase, partial [Solirubrobacter sp.]|nr:glycosyltransferase [Solirubrobacter sp.]